MDPQLFREFEDKIDLWISQGYELTADDVDGELRVTAHYVSEGGRGSERDQEFWPMAPEVVERLESKGVSISHAMAGPRPWPGKHPEEWDERA